MEELFEKASEAWTTGAWAETAAAANDMGVTVSDLLLYINKSNRKKEYSIGWWTERAEALETALYILSAMNCDFDSE